MVASSKSVSGPLQELIEISRAVGADPDLVQGGGGNTSVKSRDGESMYVKASGTALAHMDESRGWAKVDTQATIDILDDAKLARMKAQPREAEVLRRLQATVAEPAGARPSVEASLHALLDRVVIHTHPVGLNALLSSQKSAERVQELVGGKPLYIPYFDPGFTLAAHVKRAIDAYVEDHGKRPTVVLLENHGLFVAAPEEVRSELRLGAARAQRRCSAGAGGLSSTGHRRGPGGCTLCLSLSLSLPAASCHAGSGGGLDLV